MLRLSNYNESFCSASWLFERERSSVFARSCICHLIEVFVRSTHRSTMPQMPECLMNQWYHWSQVAASQIFFQLTARLCVSWLPVDAIIRAIVKQLLSDINHNQIRKHINYQKQLFTGTTIKTKRKQMFVSHSTEQKASRIHENETNTLEVLKSYLAAPTRG